MRRVLVATPLKGKVSAAYLKSAIQIITAKSKDIEIGHIILEGPAINHARPQLVQWAIDNKYDELIFWDADLVAELGMFQRLLSHRQPIVAALYTKRSLDTYFHVNAWDEDANKNAIGDGLVRVKQMAIGFSKLDLKLMRDYIQKHPERWAVMHDGGDNPTKIYDLFPMELVGPNTANARIEEVKKWLTKKADLPLNLDELKEIVFKKHPEENQFQGEDYGFCRLMREEGIPMYVDTKMIIPHSTEVSVPIPTGKLLDLINEDWRKDEVKNLTQALWPEDYVNQGIYPSHCRDVLEGTYDIDLKIEKPVILDIGANIGAFIRWADVKWPGARIHAYEPEKNNFVLLQRTIREMVKDVSVIPENVAILDHTGPMPLYYAGSNCGEYSLNPSGKIIADVLTIDAAELPKADIIKLDCEGSEYRILFRMASRGLLLPIKAVLLEYHSQPILNAIKPLMTKEGFKEVEHKEYSQTHGILKYVK